MVILIISLGIICMAGVAAVWTYASFEEYRQKGMEKRVGSKEDKKRTSV